MGPTVATVVALTLILLGLVAPDLPSVVIWLQRAAVCGAAAYMATVVYLAHLYWTVPGFAMAAIVYNPIVPVDLTSGPLAETWVLLNLLLIAVFVLTLLRLRSVKSIQAADRDASAVASEGHGE